MAAVRVKPEEKKMNTQPTTQQATNSKSAATQPITKKEILNLVKKHTRNKEEYNLVVGIIKHESNFNPNAYKVNKDGSEDHGLMQVNSKHNNLKLLGVNSVEELYDPETNIKAGIQILRGFRNRFENALGKNNKVALILAIKGYGGFRAESNWGAVENILKLGKVSYTKEEMEEAKRLWAIYKANYEKRKNGLTAFLNDIKEGKIETLVAGRDGIARDVIYQTGVKTEETKREEVKKEEKRGEKPEEVKKVKKEEKKAERPKVVVASMPERKFIVKPLDDSIAFDDPTALAETLKKAEVHVTSIKPGCEAEYGKCEDEKKVVKKEEKKQQNINEKRQQNQENKDFLGRLADRVKELNKNNNSGSIPEFSEGTEFVIKSVGAGCAAEYGECDNEKEERKQQAQNQQPKQQQKKVTVKYQTDYEKPQETTLDSIRNALRKLTGGAPQNTNKNEQQEKKEQEIQQMANISKTVKLK